MTAVEAAFPPPTSGAEIVAEVEALGARIAAVRAQVGRVILGQTEVVDQALVTLLSGGHVLLVGVPGLGKSKLVETLAVALGLASKRVQFTPDLMPADIIGAEVLDEGADGRRSFRFVPGPVFCQLLMADEINRASPRTQSALLQAMQEQRVAVAGVEHPLPRPFHVLATQNPIEQEGTYPLPEAQLDRFMLHTRVDYPDRATTLKIMALARGEAISQRELAPPAQRMSQETVFAARREILALTLSDPVAEYIAALVDATRRPEPYSTQLRQWLRWGASPRAAIAIERGARALAWLDGRDFVSPEDVQAIAPDALRHRLLVDYTAQAQGVSAESCVNELLSRVPAP